MERRALLVSLGVVLAFGSAGTAAPPPLQHPVAALTPQQTEATIRYMLSLQNKDGGFRASAAPGPSQVANTVPGLRALRYLDHPANSRQRVAADRFISLCYQQQPPAFEDVPGGKPDVRSTAMGWMALVESRGHGDTPAKAFLEENAKSIPDIYMAEAAFDAAHLHPKVAINWTGAMGATRTPEGSYGTGAYDTATAVITLLRLNGKVPDPTGAAGIIKSAQTAAGGFATSSGTAAGEADLPTTYRMMRALYMLHSRPDVSRLYGFISKCRNADGGYGVSPGKPSTIGATYNAAIVLYWASELEKG